MLAFVCLAALKFIAVISSDGANVSAALFYAAMFGSPQLIWLWILRKPPLSHGQAKTATSIVIAFLFTSFYFGSFPGTTPPTWGGEGHFEVPAALISEWLISLIGIFVFTARSKGPSAGGV
jgi:hypothetical protein